MQPQWARSDQEIDACYSVMAELRPHVRREEFVSRVHTQQAAGYELVYLQAEGKPVAVAGFRMGENLAWGRFLYVDDLVTAPSFRSQGFGAALLRWLRDVAVARGCRELHLDSGVARVDAHRFYKREGLDISSYHFKIALE